MGQNLQNILQPWRFLLQILHRKKSCEGICTLLERFSRNNITIFRSGFIFTFTCVSYFLVFFFFFFFYSFRICICFIHLCCVFWPYFLWSYAWIKFLFAFFFFVDFPHSVCFFGKNVTILLYVYLCFFNPSNEWIFHDFFQLFRGNYDRYIVVTHTLNRPITARYIRVHPRAYRGWMSMRVEFYGCIIGQWFFNFWMNFFNGCSLY